MNLTSSLASVPIFSSVILARAFLDVCKSCCQYVATVAAVCVLVVTKCLEIPVVRVTQGILHAVVGNTRHFGHVQLR